MFMSPGSPPATATDDWPRWETTKSGARRGARRAERAWPRWETPEEAGFSSDRIAEAESRWYELADPSVAAFFMVYKGKVLASFGNDTYPFWCHSVRKSFLSALYGIQVEQGMIDLESTMAELGIDDDPPITLAEKQARVVDLLRARSGVYHEAACEAQEMRDARPQRGSHPPGTFFYYNNWDFNALGTIFRQETGLDIFLEFQDGIALMVGMQDFRASDCEYSYEYQYSTHPCYKFRMSARDRARFGQLFLQKGRWGRRQVVPEVWVEESTRAHSQDIGAAEGLPGYGYGYMWTVQSPEFYQAVFADPRLHWLRSFGASGYGGQLISVFPDVELVAVVAVDVYAGVFLDEGEVGPILELILSAGPIVDLKMARVTTQQQAVTAGDFLRNDKDSAPCSSCEIGKWNSEKPLLMFVN
jgi:CubicO group peptidase (beta-lactamase class C family)